MVYFIVLSTIIAAYLLFRYVPGFKCIGFCKIKQIRQEKSINNLKDRIMYDESGMRKYVVSLKTDDLSLKQMYKLHKTTEPFGCTAFSTPDWLYSARKLLKSNIVDKELLES